MTNYVDGKVIIVTGAASGFGKVLSLKAAQLGGHIVCADINGDTLQTAVEEIETAGGSALAVQPMLLTRIPCAVWSPEG